MFVPTLITAGAVGGGALLASATDPAAGLTVYGPLGVFAFLLVGVVTFLFRRLEKSNRDQCAGHEAERERLIAELRDERADRKEAQASVREWLPLMTRAVSVLETVTPLLQTEVHLRAAPDSRSGGE